MPEMIPPQEGQQQIDPNRFAMAKSIMADNAKASQLPTGLETELDVSQFPELKDKKEGDIVQITVKVKNISGKTATVEPSNQDQSQKEKDIKTMAEPGKEDLMSQNPTQEAK